MWKNSNSLEFWEECSSFQFANEFKAEFAFIGMPSDFASVTSNIVCYNKVKNHLQIFHGSFSVCRGISEIDVLQKERH